MNLDIRGHHVTDRDGKASGGVFLVITSERRFPEMRKVMNGNQVYMLRIFSEECPAELEGLKAP